ncbi:MAG: M3 family oligoendopeptidase [Planctomycetes bacterium]|nr:M3 family oligoendopeptidase [Planctomycetota bacterium]
MAVDTLQKLPREYPRKFVPAKLEIKSFADVEPLFDKLLKADVSTKAKLEQWMKDDAELSAAIDEFGSRVQIRMTLDTTSEAYKKAFLDFVENFEPKLKPIAEKLQRKFKDSPARKDLDPKRYAVYERSVLNRLELFREANIPLETEEAKLEQKYSEIMAATMVKFEGKDYTPQAMALFLLETDRVRREASWRAAAERRYKDADAVNNLYDKLIRLREKKAANAGFKNYRDYQFRRRERFDYTPAHCEAYHKAAEEVIVPVVERIAEKRRKKLGVDKLRPWDLAVDPDGKPPLKPFTDVEKLSAGCAKIFHKVDKDLGKQFDAMRKLGLLDLDNRKGKAPGGYQSTLQEVRLPFIFMNAVGLDNDVRTLLHEGGHAFHAWAFRDEPLTDYRNAPIEFCEVASMSMELLANPYMDEFYKKEDLKRARRGYFQDLLKLLPWIATIDAFQQWIYTRPGNTIEEREDAWVKIYRRFNTVGDLTGLDYYERTRWQAQGHLFGAPFYYIEYAIAQLGALQVWLNAKKDRKAAIANYRKAMALGNSRPLPELFKAAGAKFDFGPKTVKPLVEAVEEELASLE